MAVALRRSVHAAKEALKQVVGSGSPFRICEHLFVWEATILHADLDSFYASVEQRDDPSLRGRPVIVGAGVVLAASYEAKAFGVQTPMHARPGAAALPGRDRRSASDARLLRGEQGGVPRSSTTSRRSSRDCRSTRRSSMCAACAGSPGRPVEIAERLRRAVRERVGLPITVGVARTKFLAKVASAVAKPDGLLLVAPDRELAFLHALPVESLWGVGTGRPRSSAAAGSAPSASSRASPRRRSRRCSAARQGRHLHALAHNRDPRPVHPGRRRGSIGSQRALGRSPRSPAEIDAVAIGLVERVTRRMRTAGARGPHGRAAAALRRLLPRDPLTHAPAPDRPHRHDP